MAKKNATWFRIGEEGFKEKQRLDAIAEMKKEKSVPRFRLRPQETAKIIFLDSDGFYIKEHNLKIAGRWGNYVTCTSDFKPCPVCQSGDRPTYTAYYTIIDTRTIVTSDGRKLKNRKVLLPLKGSAINIIEDIKKKVKNLRGLVFEVKRYTAQDPNCGAVFERLGRVDLKKLKDSEPYDYEKVLAPPTDEELENMGFDVTVVGSEENLDEELDDLFVEEDNEEEKEEELDDLFEENDDGEDEEDNEENDIDEEEDEEDDDLDFSDLDDEKGDDDDDEVPF